MKNKFILDKNRGGCIPVTCNRNECKGETDTANTLMARDYKGMGNQDMTAVAIKVKEATKQGYANALVGGTDSINLSLPNSKTRRGRVGSNMANTLDTSCNQGIAVKVNGDKEIYAIWYEKYQCYIAIRKLTPKECFRLQGWTDDYFEKAEFVNSNSQLFKQAGNGVTVNVIEAIARKLG